MAISWKPAARAAMLLFLVLFFFVSCKPETPPNRAPQTGALISPIKTPSTTTPVPALALPLPTVVITSWTPGAPIVLQSGKDVHLPTVTALPTITPYPTVTPQSGPIATPLPLPKPAQDATGSIVYIAHDTSNHTAIYSVNTNGAGAPQNAPRELAGTAQNLGDFVFPSFDGSRMAIVNSIEVGDAVGVFHDDKIEGLFKNNPGGLGIFLNWHPDNRHALYRADTIYTRENDYPGLWLVDADNGSISVLVPHNPPEAIRDAVVSPNGQEIIYSLQPDTLGPAQVWAIDANGSNAHLLFTAKSSAFAFAWSPDGNKIAFLDGGVLTVIDADGSNPRSLSKNFTVGYRFRPVWSPDSKIIAFVAWEDAGTSPDKQWSDAFKGTNIHLVDVATGKEHPLLSDGTTGNVDPAWSPDGTQIAFVSTRSGNSEIWVVNVDGSNLRQLTHTGQVVRFPYWRRMSESAQP